MSQGTTFYYHLRKAGQGDAFSEFGYQHLFADRDLIDALLRIGTTTHVHDGVAAEDFAPDTAPSLGLDTGGSIPSSKRVYYKFTIVDPNGIESAVSPEAHLDTPAPVQEPSPPALIADDAGGTLTGGNYFYALSAYVGTTTEETRAPSSNTVFLRGGTNAVELVMPSLPSGADGFNIYRRAPGERGYKFLASTTDESYIDDGSVTPNPNRGTPSANVTATTNAITVSLPGATPEALAEGYTWKIYRTLVNGGWDNSTLVHVIDASVTYTDLGFATSTGRYPNATPLVDHAAKIDLATEVEGLLAAGLVVYPFQVQFRFPSDPLAVDFSTDIWVNDYPAAVVIAARGALQDGSPASDEVLFDAWLGDNAATPSFDSIFAALATPVYPDIDVGRQIGERLILVTPTVVEQGQSIIAEVTQNGGGATPTDRYATLTLYCVAYDFPTEPFDHITGAGIINT